MASQVDVLLKLRYKEQGLKSILGGLGSFMGRMAGAAGLYVSFNQLTNSIKTMASYEQNMANVRATINGTATEMIALSEAARKAGENSIFSAVEVSAGMEKMAKAGLAPRQIMESLASTIELASAASIDFGKAVDLQVQANTTMGISWSDMARVNKAFVVAANNSIMSVEDIGTAFKYIGPLGKEFGMDIEQAASYLAALAQNGIKASQGGTGLRTVLLHLAKPSADAQKIWSNWGITMEENNGEAKTFGKLIDELSKKDVTLNQLFRVAEQRGAPALKALLNQMGYIDDTINEIKKDTNAAHRIAMARVSTLSGAWKQFNNVLVGSSVAAGEGGLTSLLTAGLNAISIKLRELNPQIEGFVSAFKKSFSDGSIGLFLYDALMAGWNSFKSVVKSLWSGVVGKDFVSGFLSVALAIGGVLETVLVDVFVGVCALFQTLMESAVDAIGIKLGEVLERAIGPLKYIGSKAAESISPLLYAGAKTVTDISRKTGVTPGQESDSDRISRSGSGFGKRLEDNYAKLSDVMTASVTEFFQKALSKFTLNPSNYKDNRYEAPKDLYGEGNKPVSSVSNLALSQAKIDPAALDTKSLVDVYNALSLVSDGWVDYAKVSAAEAQGGMESVRVEILRNKMLRIISRQLVLHSSETKKDTDNLNKNTERTQEQLSALNSVYEAQKQAIISGAAYSGLNKLERRTIYELNEAILENLKIEIARLSVEADAITDLVLKAKALEEVAAAQSKYNNLLKAGVPKTRYETTKQTNESNFGGDNGLGDSAKNYQSIGETLGGGLMDWTNAAGSAFNQLASLIGNVMGEISNGIANSITGWIRGTQSFGDAMREMGASMLQTTVQTLTQMGIQQAIHWGLEVAGITAAKTTEVGIVTTGEAAKAAASAAGAASILASQAIVATGAVASATTVVAAGTTEKVSILASAWAWLVKAAMFAMNAFPIPIVGPFLGIATMIAVLAAGASIIGGMATGGQPEDGTYSGKVIGDGTRTSDTAGVYALSNDEYVVRGNAASMIGYDNLDYMNTFGRMPDTIRGFATGGSVGKISGSAIASSNSSAAPSKTIFAWNDREVNRHLQSDPGYQKKVLRMVKDNKRGMI
jgi:TP901 family phage tail tape measure protein